MAGAAGGPGLGMGRLHADPTYRTMLLDEGIKPVFRISNLDADATRAALEQFRALGYVAAPCHEAFAIDASHGLYTFGEGGGSLYYLFVSRSQDHLDEILEIDRRQKTADTAATKLACALGIGRLLGYPACCTTFYASFRVNPHQATFVLRPWQSTVDAIGRRQHPVVRPLGHFACSLHCPVTEAAHERILDALHRRLPDVAAWIEPGLDYPVLLYGHQGTAFVGSGNGDRVDYTQCWHHGPVSGASDLALRRDLDAGDRMEVTGARIRVFRAGALVGDHDLRPTALLPLLIAKDGRPVGKRVRQVAVLATGERARYLTGDLLHVGHRAGLLAPPAGDPDLWAAAAAAAGWDTLVLADARDDVANAAVNAGLAVVGAGVSTGEPLPGDRHAFAHAFERRSRSLPWEPAFPQPLPGSDLARSAIAWPTPLLEDPWGELRRVEPHVLQDEGPAPDRVARLAEQVRAHRAAGGVEIAVPKGSEDALEPLLAAIDGPIRLILGAPLALMRFRELAARASGKGITLSQAVPDDALGAALDVLRQRAPGVFAQVAVSSGERTTLVATPATGAALTVGVALTSEGWRFDADRPPSADERRWLGALRALLDR